MNRDYILAPSILSADFKNLGNEMKKTADGGAAYIHFDVMDGMFVPSLSFGMPVLKSIRSATDQVMDVHLMIQEPVRYVEAFREAGADLITVHVEACNDVRETLKEIRDCGARVGLSLCPETDVKDIERYLGMADMILVMSVHPGFGGQKFIPKSLRKIADIRQRADSLELPLDIQVDGGIYLDNVRDVLDAGANIIVAGTGVFKGNPSNNTMKFMEILREYE